MEKMNNNNNVKNKIIELTKTILQNKNLKLILSVYSFMNNLIVVKLSDSSLLFFEKDNTCVNLFLLDNEEDINKLAKIMRYRVQTHFALYIEYNDLTGDISLILETEDKKIIILEKEELSLIKPINDLDGLFKRLNIIIKNNEIKKEKISINWGKFL